MDSRLKEVQISGLDRTLTIHLHAAHDQYISEEIAELGQWEPLETEIVRRLVAPGELFLDCGANLGWYSLVAATLGADVVAFEPEPGNLELLRANLRDNHLEDRVTVQAVALGRTARTAQLQLSDENQGDHRVAEHPVGHTVEVSVVRLDDVVDRTPGVVKLDTQGSEVAIFRGGHRTFDPARLTETSLILEYWPFGLANCGSSAEELIGFLTPLVGETHACFEVSEKLHLLRPITLVELAIMAREGDYSPAGEGHTNLLVAPFSSLPVLQDLIEPRSEPSHGDEPDPVTRQLDELAAAERSVHSQNGEDGLIELLAERTGAAQVIVELGASSGLECNSRLPHDKGWQVFAFDGDPEGSECVHRAFLTAENVNDVLDTAGVPSSIGVLTIDVDGNDYWLLHELDERFLPTVLVVEYNATLGPVDHLTVPYQAARRWDHSNFFGASLAAITRLARDRGFDLVCCESNGANAFFVRRDRLDDAGLVAVPVSRAYRPPRYGLVGPLGEHTGHQPSSRRFVRVDSPEAALAAFRAARGRGPSPWGRRVQHWVVTSDPWRFRSAWLEARRARWRGAGPTK